MDKKARETIQGEIPMKRFGNVGEIVDAVLFLAGGKAVILLDQLCM